MKKIFFYALGLMCALSAQASVTTFAYDGDKSKAENGTALQAAINAAAESGIDTLKVQAGTYQGNFFMKEVNVSGGWNEDFTAQTDYATILDANSSGRVLEQSAAFSTLTVWSNLTIQNGRLTETATIKAGAGVVLCDKGQVKHCLIQNNLFDAASGEASGGGVYENAYTTSVLVDDCIIRGNTASHGGGVRICGVIQNSIIENNTTTLNACGGVQLHYGGAMYNCIIRNNTGKDTGGVRITGDKACTMTNCLIISNTATGTIGGLQIAGKANHVVYNNTIVNNNQVSESNAARCGVHLNTSQNYAAKFINNIVWGNTTNSSAQTDQLQITGVYNAYAATNFLNNAIVRPSTYGTGTILLDKDTDPGFVDAANGDYSLLWTSDLVNAGTDNFYTEGDKDLAGNARKAGSHVDIGAYELPYYTLTIAAFDHATLTVGGNETPAGSYSLPEGYTTTATIEPAEGYVVESVTCGDAVLVADEGEYTLPALLTDLTLAISIKVDPTTGIINTNSQRQCQKLIKNGQLLILRDGKEFNVLGSQL